MSSAASSSTGPQNSQYTENLKSAWDDIQENLYAYLAQSAPTMVFSVIGDSDNFVPNPWQKTVFQTALIEAAKNGGETWILHQGNDMKISNIVRDAYRNYEIMEFGTDTVDISDSNRHIKLISIAEDGCDQPTVYKMPKDYVSRSGGVNTFWVDFEKFISEKEVFFFGSNIDFKIPIPVTIFVCEGDLGTIAHISKALQNNIPVVVMKGSGKAADLVLDYLKSPDDHAEVLKTASMIFGIENKDRKLQEMKGHLENISKHRDCVGVFDLDKDDPLKLLSIVGNEIANCRLIQNALKNLKNDTIGSENKTKKLDNQTTKFPTVFNRFEMSSATQELIKTYFQDPTKDIKRSIFEHMKGEPMLHVLNQNHPTLTSLPLFFYFGYQIVEEIGPALLFEAIKMNRCGYVKDLLDRGIQFDMNTLYRLYEETVFRHYENRRCGLKIMELALKEDIAKKCLEESQNDIDRALNSSVEKAAQKCVREILRYKDIRKDINSEDNFLVNVLLWAIFANRRDLAEIFWLRGKDHLYTGLVCSAILKKLSIQNSDREPSLSHDQKEHSKLFEQRCLNLMDRMYKAKRELSIYLVDINAEIWGIPSSPMTIALENSMHDILAHISSKKNMNRTWHNTDTLYRKSLFVETKISPKQSLEISSRKKTALTWSSPKMKYIFNCIMDIVVLVMYSVFVLTSIGTEYGVTQWFIYPVYFWSIGNTLEVLFYRLSNIRAIMDGHTSFSLWTYVTTIWHWFDSVSYDFLLMAVIVRSLNTDETFSVSRHMHALALLFMYFRILKVLLLFETIGMTVMTMISMLKHLATFLVIAVILGFGVGIYYHANIWPDHQSMWNGNVIDWRIWTILLYPHWQLYGELNIENIDGSDQENCTYDALKWEADPTIKRCPEKDWTVPLITAMYLMLSNLLLVNIIIAKFSATFDKVMVKSKNFWHYNRYQVICEYKIRIPSPFNIPIRVFQILFYIFTFRISECRKNQVSDATLDKDTKRKLESLQRDFQKIIAMENHNLKENN